MTREHKQTLLNRIAELGKKVEGGEQKAALEAKIRDLENKRTGSQTVEDW